LAAVCFCFPCSRRSPFPSPLWEYVFIFPCEAILPGLVRVGQIKIKLFVPGFWPNLGPGRRPLDAVRRDTEFAGVFCVRRIFDCQFRAQIQIWEIRPKTKSKVCASKTGIMLKPQCNRSGNNSNSKQLVRELYMNKSIWLEWKQNATEVNTYWNRSETEGASKWFKVKAKCNNHELQVKTKSASPWKRSETEAKSECKQSENDMKPKWTRSEIKVNTNKNQSDFPPPNPPIYLQLPLSDVSWMFPIGCGWFIQATVWAWWWHGFVSLWMPTYIKHLWFAFEDHTVAIIRNMLVGSEAHKPMQSPETQKHKFQTQQRLITNNWAKDKPLSISNCCSTNNYQQIQINIAWIAKPQFHAGFTIA